MPKKPANIPIQPRMLLDGDELRAKLAQVRALLKKEKRTAPVVTPEQIEEMSKALANMGRVVQQASLSVAQVASGMNAFASAFNRQIAQMNQRLANSPRKRFPEAAEWALQWRRVHVGDFSATDIQIAAGKLAGLGGWYQGTVVLLLKHHAIGRRIIPKGTVGIVVDHMALDKPLIAFGPSSDRFDTGLEGGMFDAWFLTESRVWFRDLAMLRDATGEVIS